MGKPTKYPFAEVSQLTPGGAGRFEGTVNAEWTIGGKPNGGYLLAMLCRAATAMGEHPHPTAASAHYLRAPDPGPVTVEAELLRAGRSASQFRARMVQDGKPCAEALITTSALDPETVPYWDLGTPDPGETSIAECVKVPGQMPNGTRVAIMDQAEIWLEPKTAGFAAGTPSGRGELRGWVALPHGEPFDPVALMYAADSLPPATLDITPSGWVPTLELTVYVRALPQPGPVRVLQRVQLIDGDRFDEECTVWDQAGRLVVQARQLAAIRLR